MSHLSDAELTILAVLDAPLTKHTLERLRMIVAQNAGASLPPVTPEMLTTLVGLGYLRPLDGDCYEITRPGQLALEAARKLQGAK